MYQISPLNINSSVIRQKGESQNGSFKKTKHAKFSEKMYISYPLIRTPYFAAFGLNADLSVFSLNAGKYGVRIRG